MVSLLLLVHLVYFLNSKLSELNFRKGPDGREFFVLFFFIYEQYLSSPNRDNHPDRASQLRGIYTVKTAAVMIAIIMECVCVCVLAALKDALLEFNEINDLLVQLQSARKYVDYQCCPELPPLEGPAALGTGPLEKG